MSCVLANECPHPAFIFNFFSPKMGSQHSRGRGRLPTFAFNTQARHPLPGPAISGLGQVRYVHYTSPTAFLGTNEHGGELTTGFLPDSRERHGQDATQLPFITNGLVN